MSKDHEYSSIEKLETGAISALNEIPNISKVAKGAQKASYHFWQNGALIVIMKQFN